MSRTPARVRSDGRLLRTERSRRQIVEAIVALVRAGQVQPTVEAIAEHAGVGTRTVFRHFEDKEALARAVAARIAAEMTPLLDLTPIRGTLAERAHQLVGRRARFYERIAPFRRAGIVERGRSWTVGRARAALDTLHRTQLEAVFRSELERLDRDLVEVVDALTSFEAWDRLRLDQRLSRVRAAAAMERGLLALFAAGS